MGYLLEIARTIQTPQDILLSHYELNELNEPASSPVLDGTASPGERSPGPRVRQSTADIFEAPANAKAMMQPDHALRRETTKPKIFSPSLCKPPCPQGSREAQQKLRPVPNVKVEWLPAVQSLVDWFMNLIPPSESFELEKHLHIADPVTYFESLRQDIRSGPEGARAKMGTLQDDLRKLKALFSTVEEIS